MPASNRCPWCSAATCRRPSAHHLDGCATKTVPYWWNRRWLTAIAKSLTLKNLPDELHARLRAAAKRHRRSLNNEAIVCLEAGLGVPAQSVDEELAEIRALRESLGPHIFDPEEIDAFKREGRP